jgi:hypothetical protein
MYPALKGGDIVKGLYYKLNHYLSVAGQGGWIQVSTGIIQASAV